MERNRKVKTPWGKEKRDVKRKKKEWGGNKGERGGNERVRLVRVEGMGEAMAGPREREKGEKGRKENERGGRGIKGGK